MRKRPPDLPSDLTGGTASAMYHTVPSTYSISEAQAKFPALVKEAVEKTVTITRRNAVVGYLISPERMEGILETLEILSNPEAMRAIEAGETGRATYLSLEALDEADKG